MRGFFVLVKIFKIHPCASVDVWKYSGVMQKITLPLIHLNGTSRNNLMDGYDKAAYALSDFENAFDAIEFNARDYYPKGPEVFEDARKERQAIRQKIAEMREYLDTIRGHLYDENEE